MSTPPLNAIDLAALSNPTPNLSAIDLMALDQPTNAAQLEFVAAGSGGVPAIGSGSALLSFSAGGNGLIPLVGEGQSIALSVTASGNATNGYSGSGAASLGIAASGLAYQDWLSKLPPVQIQELYRLMITGAPDGQPDLHIGGISSWQATSQADGRSSYLQAVIPAADQHLTAIEARQNGELVIQKGYRFADGSSRYEEILRSNFDTLRPDRGRSSLTVTVSGYLPGQGAPSGSRVLNGIRSVSTSNGKRRVRCNVDLFLKPGMTVHALGESFVASYINYYVTQADKFCEVGER